MLRRPRLTASSVASGSSDGRKRFSSKRGKGFDSILNIVKGFAKNEDRAVQDDVSSHGRNTVRGSVDDGDRVIKSELLHKQGGKVKSWHKRLFVLREHGLYYYRDSESFQVGDEPLGRVSFMDMYSLSGNQKVAEELPITIHVLIGFKFVFCVHTETRTYVVAAPTKESSIEWTEAINEAYFNFLKNNMRKNALMSQVWLVAGDEDLYVQAQALTKSSSDVNQVLEQMIESLADQFAKDVTNAYKYTSMGRTFHAWKTYYRYMKATEGETRGEAVVTASPHYNTYFKKKTVTTVLRKSFSTKKPK